VMPNLAATPTGTSSMWDKSTLNCVESDISQTNGQPFHIKLFIELCIKEQSLDLIPGTFSPLNFISTICGIIDSGVKLTKHFPLPNTWTWFGTSPSFTAISSWPSPACDASTKIEKN
jgi:hypothetical protein